MWTGFFSHSPFAAHAAQSTLWSLALRSFICCVRICACARGRARVRVRVRVIGFSGDFARLLCVALLAAALLLGLLLLLLVLVLVLAGGRLLLGRLFEEVRREDLGGARDGVRVGARDGVRRVGIGVRAGVRVG